ncbi:MAG TPA: hypothetical protein VGE08_25710 [Steroidobacter sp.]|uniref:hypothetical protein n=1 Tax=Steroidobacter sp. TaxID=1978227 RepID=UPI002EDA97C0
MKKVRAWMLLGAALLVGGCASAPSPQLPARPSSTPDLSGHWVLTTESQMGAQDSQMIVRQSGSSLVGTIIGEAGEVDYTGSVHGAAVSFDFILDVQGTALKLDYSGTVEGDTITGKAVFGQFGEGTFTARRK